MNRTNNLRSQRNLLQLSRGILSHFGLTQTVSFFFVPMENCYFNQLFMYLPLLKGLGHAILGNFSTDQIVIELA